MSQIKKLWLVRNPSTLTESVDEICWEQDMRRLGVYVVGTGIRQYEYEEHTFYSNESEAKADAEKRLAKMQAAKAKGKSHTDYVDPPPHVRMARRVYARFFAEQQVTGSIDLHAELPLSALAMGKGRLWIAVLLSASRLASRRRR